MNKATQLMLVLSLLTLLLVMALMSGLIKSERWEVTQLEVAAEYNRISAEQIRLTVAKASERSFFRVNVKTIKDDLESIPWVKKAYVVKKWPNMLKVKVFEHKAVAVWNNHSLLNQNGHIFEVEAVDNLKALPALFGAEEKAIEILDSYTRFNQLLKPIGFEIQEAHVSVRGAWLMVMRNGLELTLGTSQYDAKLIRLAETWDQLLAASASLPESVDLRYTNGYVVKWRVQKNLEELMPIEHRDSTNTGELG
ncbi:MAG: cell division protein FtsQ/DivIB [Proteobacteria bacterium]|nr:cell division protein FtsQ/DivIB [Pseudomonadota bacterium]